MRRIMLLTSALALLAAACGSTGESQDPPSSPGASGGGTTASGSTAAEVPVPDPIRGCVPSCNPPGLTQPGPLPPGPYETQWFFGGEMVITPTESWNVHEDSTGEFALELGSTPWNAVYFWEDVYPLENDERVDGVPMTAGGLLDWIRENPRLEASKPHRGRIGDLPATVVDVSISEGTANEGGADCPVDVCIGWLGFPQWEGPWGIAVPQVQRVYLSEVAYGGKTHLFVALIYPDNPADMETFSPHAEDLLATVQVPASPA
jgi:hypothetical protein